MNLREKFEWDVQGRNPQSAVKDGLYNPEYVKLLEDEYFIEADNNLKTMRKEYDLVMGHLKEAIEAIPNMLIQNDIYNLSGMESWVVKQDLLAEQGK